MFSRWKSNRQAAAFDQLWDQLQAADGSRPTGARERPNDVGAIETVLAHDDAPAIDSVFSAILLKDLTIMHTQQQFGLRPNGHGAPGITPGRLPTIPSGLPVGERHGRGGSSRFRFAAALAMVIVLLALGALAVRPQPPSEFSVIPAAVVREESQVESETLVDISVPPGRLRGDDGSYVVFGEHLIPAGGSLDSQIVCDSSGFFPLYMLEGAMTAELASPSFVLRAGDTSWETVAAGEAVEIHAGDTWLYEKLTNEGANSVRTSGSSDARYIWVGGRHETPECDVAPPKGLQIVWDRVEDPSGALDPTQPVRYVLRRVTIAPGGEMSGEIGGFPIPTEDQVAMGARQWSKVLSGQLTVTRETAGEVAASTISASPSVVATQEDWRSSEDEKVTLSNATDTPVELIVLDIIVGDPEAAGGVAAPPVASPAAGS